jgi:acyl transferase domain-containing protein
MTKTVFMYSGQGSQYFQMGQSLYAAHQSFRRELDRLDGVAVSLWARSVLEALYAPGRAVSTPMVETKVSHPAIVMVEYALTQALARAGVVPDLVLGTSLGSYTAAAVAGAMSIEEALAAAYAHARALELRCSEGAMLAVLAPPTLFSEDFLRCRSELAAVNFATHFVISMPKHESVLVERELLARDVPSQRIPVSFAFHSRWIDDARDDFEGEVHSVRLRSCRVPLMCCDRVNLLTQLQGSYLWDVTRHPIRFPEAIAHLERSGPCRYIDLGPAGTLATFLKYLLPAGSASTAQPILSPYGNDLRNWSAATSWQG